MSEDQFTKLFKYMQRQFGLLEKRFEKEEREHADIRASIAELAVDVKICAKNFWCCRQKYHRLPIIN